MRPTADDAFVCQACGEWRTDLADGHDTGGERQCLRCHREIIGGSPELNCIACAVARGDDDDDDEEEPL